MSWIKLTQYLPGDNREIQIWNEPPVHERRLAGNQTGYYSPKTGKWYCNHRDGGQEELQHVTHWAEKLGKPEEI